jgi:hypothetical protein
MVVLLLLQAFSPTVKLEIPRWWTEKKLHSSLKGAQPRQPDGLDRRMAAKAPVGSSLRLSLRRSMQLLLR